MEYKDRFDEYRAFIESPTWKSQKEARKRLDGFRCVSCGKTEHLEVHHKVYRDPLSSCDIKNDLITLCHDCHEKIESIKRHRFDLYIDMRSSLYLEVKSVLQCALMNSAIKYWNTIESETARWFNFITNSRKGMPYGDHAKLMSAISAALPFEPFSEYIKGFSYAAAEIPPELKQKASAATRARIARGEVKAGSFNSPKELQDFVKSYLTK